MLSIEKQLADTKKAFHEARTELAYLKGKDDARVTTAEPAVDWLDEMADDDMVDSKAVKDMIRRSREEFASVLKARDSYYTDQLERRDPERFALQEMINERKYDGPWPSGVSPTAHSGGPAIS